MSNYMTTEANAYRTGAVQPADDWRLGRDKPAEHTEETTEEEQQGGDTAPAQQPKHAADAADTDTPDELEDAPDK